MTRYSGHCSWIAGNDTLNCGDAWGGKNPAPPLYENHCVEQDGRRRAGFWKKSDSAEMMETTGAHGLRDWQKYTALPEDIVPVNGSDGISVWEAIEEPSWRIRNMQRFAGLWKAPLDPEMLRVNSTFNGVT